MLYVISKTQNLDELFFVKADNSGDACNMVGVEDSTLSRRLLTDNDVQVLKDNSVALIRA